MNSKPTKRKNNRQEKNGIRRPNKEKVREING